MTETPKDKKIIIQILSGREISIRNIKRKLGTGDIYKYLCDETILTDLKDAVSFAKENNLNYITAILVKHMYPNCIACHCPIINHHKYCPLHYPICKSCGSYSKKGCHYKFCKIAYPSCIECGVELNKERHYESCSKAK